MWTERQYLRIVTSFRRMAQSYSPYFSLPRQPSSHQEKTVINVNFVHMDQDLPSHTLWISRYFSPVLTLASVNLLPALLHTTLCPNQERLDTYIPYRGFSHLSNGKKCPRHAQNEAAVQPPRKLVKLLLSRASHLPNRV